MLIARAQGRIQGGIRGDHGHRAVKEPGRSIHFALFHADQIELGLARIDQNFARRVLEIKLASTGARGVMMPRAAAASRVALPFLDLDFVEVAWGARNGTGHGGPADGLAADRHQSHRDASDGHFGRVFDHPILAVNAKPFEERVEAKAEPEDQRKVDSSDSSTHPSPESRSKCVRPLARPSLAFSAGEWATLRGWNWTRALGAPQWDCRVFSAVHGPARSGRQPLASRLSLVQTHTSGTRHQGFTWLLGARSPPLGGSQPGQRLTSRIDESMLPQGSREYKLPLRFWGTKQQGSVE